MATDNSRDVSNPSIPAALGPLETEVMDLVWSRGEATVREVYRVLLTRREIAYTTVMTIMSHLANKGALRRRQQGRAYVYVPAFSRDEFDRARMTDIVDRVLGRFSEPVMAYLVDRMAQVDPQRLAEQEEAIARLRRKGKEPPSD